jgi:hypothetical protein
MTQCRHDLVEWHKRPVAVVLVMDGCVADADAADMKMQQQYSLK